MKLTDITEKTPLIKDFGARLAKSTKQKVVATVFNKVKRVAGVSAMPVDFNLENGQVVTAYVRVYANTDIALTKQTKISSTAPLNTQENKSNLKDSKRDFDIYRIDINGKQLPITGDFDNTYKPSFNKSVDEVAAAVSQGQAAFDKKQATIKVKQVNTTRNASLSIAKKIEVLQTQAVELDQQIVQKEQEKQTLQTQLETLKSQRIA
ncbi:hypothetical protein ACF3NV_05840 [Moraxella atlantae]|uniref:hypothetical protein n=1 Tax=Faucicola atlantae TaxID=34059 RepID=UPI003751196A